LTSVLFGAIIAVFNQQLELKVILNTTEQTAILNKLEQQGLVDVYFCKGKLVVINSYDVDTINDILKQNNRNYIPVCSADQEFSF
jgi:hypothetical protein